MNKGRWIILGLIVVIFSVSACGKNNAISDTTELLEVGEGIVFQTLEEETSEATEMDISELDLMAEDIEGMSEKSTALLRYAKIYAKPSTSSAVIGEGGRGEELGVYGKLETGEWYVVSYNGRVGYVRENCIKQEEVENIISTPKEEETPDREPTSSNSNHDNASNNSENQTPSNNNTTTPNNSQTQEPENSEGEVSGNGGNTTQIPENNENQVPSDNGNQSNNESEVPDSTESIKSENSESATQNPDSNGNEGNTTSNPDNDGTQNPSNGESETPDNSEAEPPEAGGAQTPEQNNSELPDNGENQLSANTESGIAEDNDNNGTDAMELDM